MSLSPEKKSKQVVEDYDVIIVGAGMVGATMACALGDSDVSVAIIDAYLPAFDWPKDGSDGSIDMRVSAITQASQNVFESLGVWSAMEAMRTSPFHEMTVWDAAGKGQVNFDCTAVGVERLGTIIENRVVQRSLIEKLASFDNVTLHCPARITDMTAGSDDGDLPCVHLEDGRIMRCELLVGADGGQSRVRSLAGITTSGWSYGQKAIVATVTTELSHQATAWQRFLHEGPLAFLPLSNGASSIVWTVSPSRADELLALDDVGFMAELSAAFEHRLGAVLTVGERAAFPLTMRHADSYVAPHLALIGDAAHVIHPLAGQGANLGLMDAASLAEVIVVARNNKREIGSSVQLRRYARSRKGDVVMMINAMEGFKRLFGASSSWLIELRNQGMGFVDRTAPFKNCFIQQMVATSGDLPALARRRRA